MFLSIIVPVYNSEKYIAQCLDSLLNQNLQSTDYEIICVDDGSTDGSSAVLSQYAGKYTNIHILSQCNKGSSAARNSGLNRAKGDYVWFVDADDLISPHILGTLKNIAEINNYDRVSFGCYMFHGSLNEKEQAMYESNTLQINHYTGDVYIWNSIFNRSFLEAHHINFNERLCTSEDGLFMLEFNRCKPKKESIDKVYYLYRRHNGSLCADTSQKMSGKKVNSYIGAAKKADDLYAIAEDSQSKQVIADFIMSNIWSALFFISQMNGADRKKPINRMKHEGLFPYKKAKECTIKKSYQTSRTDWYGKLFDWIYVHSHTSLGFSVMVLFQSLRRLKKKS